MADGSRKKHGFFSMKCKNRYLTYNRRDINAFFLDFYEDCSVLVAAGVSLSKQTRTRANKGTFPLRGTAVWFK